MNKIKVIDLLNMISKGEEIPKKVEYEGVIFENKDGDLLNDMNCSLFEHRMDRVEKLLPMLNDEVEIIEEEKKIPEKLRIGLKQTKENGIHNTLIIGDSQYELNEKEEMICKKIHEIIDYLKSKGE